MKEWTREERYRALHSPEEIKDLHDRICTSVFRQTYHVQPVTGLSNDPNGFVFHQGKWHLFYQWFPWGPVHGLKYWYHTTSEDLLHWVNEGVGLSPDSVYDNKGVFSGTAITEDDDLYFFYTGNHRDENWVRIPYTCVAFMDRDGTLVKLPKPLFGPRDDCSEHQRDPKVVYHKGKNKYYIFLGAQTLDRTGTILIYQSDELLSGWSFAGQLKVTGYEHFGGMWECPCIVNISGKDVLIFSPQHIKLPGRGESTNHNVYLIGKMDYETLTFIPESDFHHLDYGFDFYAAQTASNVGDPNKAILIGWMGLPDNHYPTEEEDWEGSLTLPRELRIVDGRLIQTPVSGIETLREAEIPADGTLPTACELEVRSNGGDFDLNLFTRADGSGGMRLHYDDAKRICTVDRSGMDRRFNQQVGEILDMPLEQPLHRLSVFIDRSSIELFANDGEAVFTSHIYPTVEECHYKVSDSVSVRIWTMKSSVKDDFVI